MTISISHYGLEPICFIDGALGIYIPKKFADAFNHRERITGISDSDWLVLEEGPDHTCYWDVWSAVEQNARIKDDNGNEYTVFNSCDCWLVPVGMEWSEEEDFFVWPVDVENES